MSAEALDVEKGRTGVLLLVYGGPRTPEDVEPFLSAIAGGRSMPPAVVAEVRRRYAAIGGRSPLPGITDALAAALEARLNSSVPRYEVAVGSLYSRPSIEDAVATLAAHGVARADAVSLVPQYSALTVGRYLTRLETALQAAGNPFAVATVHSWATHPLLVRAFAERLRAATSTLPPLERDAPEVLFTAHSVPVAAMREGDPYVEEITATADAVARSVGIGRWRLAFQSPGRSGGEWLGPTVEAAVGEAARAGRRQVIVVPIQFLADNLEILYDLDVELRERAERLGIRLVRSASLNTSPLLVGALADLAATQHAPLPR